MKNVTVPEAGPSLPDRVAVSLTVPPKSTVDALTWVARSGGTQVLKSPAMKSFSCALTSCDERVSTRKLLKHGTSPSKTSLRSRPPSKKLNSGNVPDGPDLGVYGHGAGVAASLATPQASSVAGEPVQTWPVAIRSSEPSDPPDPTHSNSWISLVAPPFSKWLTTNRSPIAWTGSNVPGLPGMRLMPFLKNQKPIALSPLLAKRSAPKYMMSP